MLQKRHLATFFKKVILRLFGHFFLFNLFRQNYFQIRENVANTPSNEVFGNFRHLDFHYLF